MLSLLLDENLSPEIAVQITVKRPDILVTSVHHWQEGRFKSQRDEAILEAAHEAGLTLVTYDQKTILPVLVQWGQAETDHSGVIFIDDRSFASNDFGAIIRALIKLWDDGYAVEWTNRVDFLRTLR